MFRKQAISCVFAAVAVAGCGDSGDDEPTGTEGGGVTPPGATEGEASSATVSASEDGSTSAGLTGGESSGDSGETTTGGNEPEPISADFPFDSHFVDVLGSRMHYVDEGEGAPVLMLHGQPMSSYLWRNIIPHVAAGSRVIAVDLIGFGKSDKPDLAYRVADHSRYVEGFIDALGIDDDLTLVVHDWGSYIGFEYAMRHESQIRGLVFMESMLRPIPGFDFWDEQTAMFMQAVRTPDVGEQMIFQDNVFIEGMIPSMILRDLTVEEHDAYREPFLDASTRLPMLMFPRELAIGGEPADTHATQVAYLEALQQSEVPKLHIYANPGVVNTADDVQWAADNLPNTTSLGVGDGLHFIQEDHPHEIGRGIAGWLADLD